MVTGEDYNIVPLTANQEIIKVKSTNRVRSGISRYFDLKDAWVPPIFAETGNNAPALI